MALRRETPHLKRELTSTQLMACLDKMSSKHMARRISLVEQRHILQYRCPLWWSSGTANTAEQKTLSFAVVRVRVQALVYRNSCMSPFCPDSAFRRQYMEMEPARITLPHNAAHCFALRTPSSWIVFCLCSARLAIAQPWCSAGNLKLRRGRRIS